MVISSDATVEVCEDLLVILSTYRAEQRSQTKRT